MKAQLLFIFLFCTVKLFCQDTSVVWIKTIDTLAFKISYDKKDIPKECYENRNGIVDLKTILNSNEEWFSGRNCVRFLWIAKDKYNHTVICTYYGYCHGYKDEFVYAYYYFDKDNKGKKINTNTLYFDKKKSLTFGETSKLIKSRNYMVLFPEIISCETK